jgi:RNA polymerase sigma-70 factor (ECF subfamily)
MAHSDEDGDIPRMPSLVELIDAQSSFVWRSLRQLGVSEADLPDQVQEVFLVVHRRGESFEGRNTVRSWIYGICRRIALAHRRRAHVRHEALVASPEDRGSAPRQHQQAELRDQLVILERALGQLSDEVREVFVLFEIEEIPMKEVAVTLGCPLQTAYSRLHVAREHVRRAFAAAEGKSPTKASAR